MVGRAFVLWVRCVRMGFQRFAIACDPGDLLQVGIMDQPIGWREDVDGALLQAPMVLVPVLGEVSGGLCVPVDGLQHVEGLRGMTFHGDHIIRRLGHQGGGLAGGMEGLHCDDMSRDITALQQVLGQASAKVQKRMFLGHQIAYFL